MIQENKTATLFRFLLSCFLLLSTVNSVDVNVGIFSSISGVNAIEGRVPLQTFLTSAISLLAEINNLNAGLPTVPFQVENDLDPSQPVNEFTCDVTLVPYVVDTIGDLSEGLSGFSIINDNVPLHGIIGSVRSSVTVPLSFVSSTDEIPIISFGATSPRLSDVNTHKFFSRTVISDVEIAKTYVDFLLEIGISQAVVLYIEDDYGSAFKDALFSISDDVGFEFELIPYPANSGQAEIEDVVRRVKQTQLNVVLAICFDVDAVSIMEAAVKEDPNNDEESWVGPGKLWVFTDGVASVEDLVDVFNSQKPNATIEDKELFISSLDGMFLLNQVAERELTFETITAQNERFDSRLGWNVDQLEEIYKKLPGGEEYLFGERNGVEFDAQQTLNLSDITSEGINYFGYFALDALIVFRNVVERLAFDNCDNIGNFTGAQFVDALQTISSDGIQGITGDLEFDASGTRSLASGAVQLVKMNLDLDQEGLLVTSSEQQAVFQEGAWDISNLQFLGDQSVNFTDIPDSVERNEVDQTVLNAMKGFAGLGLFIVGLLSLWLFVYQHYQVVAAAQPFDQSFKRYTDTENNLRCNFRYYLFSFGLTVIYTSLLIKLRKIMGIFNATVRNDKFVPIHTKSELSDLVPIFSIVINILLLFLLFFLSQLEYKTRIVTRDEFGQVTETYGICTLADNGYFSLFILLFIFHGTLYIYGVSVVFQARKISSDFHDGFSVAMSVLVQVELSILAVPIMIAIGPEESTIFYLVQGLVVLVFCVILLGLLFGEKVYRVAIGDTEVIWHIDNNLDEGLTPSHNGSLSLDENDSQSSRHTMKTNNF
eukprot:snap_masked-scaffold_9-processed-gene-5.31-mRNA-1 protein AED:1.00 eAED:1.00 QI:0/0/0/0/1/1/2/0/823